MELPAIERKRALAVHQVAELEGTAVGATTGGSSSEGGPMEGVGVMGSLASQHEANLSANAAHIVSFKDT
jgi:hypothetical protein